MQSLSVWPVVSKDLCSVALEMQSLSSSNLAAAAGEKPETCKAWLRKEVQMLNQKNPSAVVSAASGEEIPPEMLCPRAALSTGCQSSGPALLGSAPSWARLALPLELHAGHTSPAPAPLRAALKDALRCAQLGEKISSALVFCPLMVVHHMGTV